MEEHTIGQRIAARRRELGLSQADLGDRLGVSRQAISKWESDAAIPEVDKLIALSRLFGVSVGWLLGVEDFGQRAGDVDGQDDAPFTARERELLELLSRPRPMSLWAKWTLIAIGVVAALSLLISAVQTASIRRQAENFLIQFQEEYLRVSDAFSANTTVPTLAPNAMNVELTEYAFHIEPYTDSTGALVQFQAIPACFDETMTARLLVNRHDQAVARAECVWDGTALTAELLLPAANDYELWLLITDADEVTCEYRLADRTLSNLRTGLTMGKPQVVVASRSWNDMVLTLENIRVRMQLPAAWRDVKDPWTRCDLVVCADEVEVGRIDLLNRSEYSQESNFGELTVDFLTRNQTFQLPQGPGQHITVTLECAFWNHEAVISEPYAFDLP